MESKAVYSRCFDVDGESDDDQNSDEDEDSRDDNDDDCSGNQPEQPLSSISQTQPSILTEVSTSVHTQPFRFLDLPPELRNNIYKLACPQPDEDRPDFAFQLYIPSFCQINRRIRTEALSVLFSSRSYIMRIEHPGDLYRTIHWLSLAQTYHFFPGHRQQFDLIIPGVVDISFIAIPNYPCVCISESRRHAMVKNDMEAEWRENICTFRKVEKGAQRLVEAANYDADMGIKVAHVAKIIRLIYRDGAFDYSYRDGKIETVEQLGDGGKKFIKGLSMLESLCKQESIRA